MQADETPSEPISIGTKYRPEHPEIPARDVELIVSVPLDPMAILKFQAWLKEIGMTALGTITPSWNHDTIINMTFSPPFRASGPAGQESSRRFAVSEEPPPEPGVPDSRLLRVILATA